MSFVIQDNRGYYLVEGSKSRGAQAGVGRGDKILTLDVDQLVALRTFADANGRSWKSKLNVAWSTGRYDDYNGTDDYGTLQYVRNTFGPTWLLRFSFDNPKTHSVRF